MDLHGGNSSACGVQTDDTNRYLRNEYGRSNNGVGIKVNGNYNTVHNGAGATGNSGDGVQVYGNCNYLTDTNSFANGGNGFNVTGNSNQLLKLDAGDKGKGNAGDGVVVSGTGNQLTEISSAFNSATGYTVSASGNKLKKNTSSTNTGVEYVIGANNVNQLENKKNGTSFSFGAAGGSFN